ncbi:hypothetical protein, partial [Kitasatospora aureofaciens]|uniref:hypothetical protein n=1 Tax=Kitasatospora aureofaciens TaxID=1894 RepID=UPI0034107E06
MTNPAGRNPRGREDRLARLTPEQRAAFEARARGRAGAAPGTGSTSRRATRSGSSRRSPEISRERDASVGRTPGPCRKA